MKSTREKARQMIQVPNLILTFKYGIKYSHAKIKLWHDVLTQLIKVNWTKLTIVGR